jgi:glycerophosphoryl diester phosphodiesterase
MLKVPSWLVDVPLAHRGLHGDGVPENSLPAFAAAATAG